MQVEEKSAELMDDQKVVEQNRQEVEEKVDKVDNDRDA